MSQLWNWLDGFHLRKKQQTLHQALYQQLQYAIEQWRELVKQDVTLVIVSNELGMGVHPEKEVARKFADLQGWMNQIIGKTANELYLMVSGVPMKVK